MMEETGSGLAGMCAACGRGTSSGKGAMHAGMGHAMIKEVQTRLMATSSRIQREWRTMRTRSMRTSVSASRFQRPSLPLCRVCAHPPHHGPLMPCMRACTCAYQGMRLPHVGSGATFTADMHASMHVHMQMRMHQCQMAVVRDSRNRRPADRGGRV